MISAAECLGAHHLNGLGEIFTTPEEMSRVVFALVSDNPWHDHLGTLAEHLRVTGYYAILTDKEPLLEALARLPEDVKLITVSVTDLERPTRLEELKDPKHGEGSELLRTW